MKKGLLIGGILAGLVVVAGAFGLVLMSQRNALVNANENVTASWSQVENVLQRRSDLIPNLVNTVKGIAKQEKEVFTAIADARARMAGAGTIQEKLDANRQVESALARLLIVVEKYPELRSSQNFASLQDELAGTENRIAVERKRFNDAVQNYNVLVARFPTNIAASMFHFQRRDEYFEAAPEAKTAPKVEF
jgi:LemA protein